MVYSHRVFTRLKSDVEEYAFVEKTMAELLEQVNN